MLKWEKERTTGITGQYGLGTRNERGERLIELCHQNELLITNTYFKQHARKLYTWKNPDVKTRNQIQKLCEASKNLSGVRHKFRS